jgi:outer membrane murein-binding lipoprotein Lpp
MRRLLHDYGLSFVLAGLFLSSLVVQTWAGWHAYADEQQTHGEAVSWLGNGGYIWHWGEAVFENWQSEFLQLLAFVVLTSFLIHRGSHESRDGDDELKAQVSRLEAKIDRLMSERESDHGDQEAALQQEGERHRWQRDAPSQERHVEER